MKALSLRQPWAYAVLNLGKRVENRDWRACAYRGPVLLHASSRVVLTPTKREPESFGDAVDRIIEIIKPAPGAEGDLVSRFAVVSHDRRGSPRWEPAPSLPLGGIVGRARIVSVERGGGGAVAARDQERWWTGGFGLLLADVEPLPFIPWKGSLGFFEVPDATVQEAKALWPAAGEVRDLPMGGYTAIARIEDWAARGFVEILRGGPTRHVYRRSGWNEAQS